MWYPTLSASGIFLSGIHQCVKCVREVWLAADGWFFVYNESSAGSRWVCEETLSLTEVCACVHVCAFVRPWVTPFPVSPSFFLCLSLWFKQGRVLYKWSTTLTQTGAGKYGKVPGLREAHGSSDRLQTRNNAFLYLPPSPPRSCLSWREIHPRPALVLFLMRDRKTRKRERESDKEREREDWEFFNKEQVEIHRVGRHVCTVSITLCWLISRVIRHDVQCPERHVQHELIASKS